jgi:CheY-like chemotaxis protein
MKRKLLHIDDHRASRLLVQKILSPYNWQVKTCTSREAMTQATAERWDVFLLEIALTDINGLDLLKQLQSHSNSRTIPVIFLTSRVMPDEIAHYQQLPIAGVIAKPFDVETLATEISEKLSWPLDTQM